MAINIGTGVTTITGDVNLEPVIKTVTCISGTQTNSGTTTLGTVGAGKVWNIIGASIGAEGGNNPGQCSLKGNNIAILSAYAYSATNYGLIFLSQSWQYGTCPKLTAGQTITLVCTNLNGLCDAQVQYIEESA